MRYRPVMPTKQSKKKLRRRRNPTTRPALVSSRSRAVIAARLEHGLTACGLWVRTETRNQPGGQVEVRGLLVAVDGTEHGCTLWACLLRGPRSEADALRHYVRRTCAIHGAGMAGDR